MTTEGAVLGILRAARPRLRSAHDRIAFVVHAIFQSAGYSLVAVGSRVPPEVPDGDEEVEEVGIDGWNDMDDAYAFLYSGAGNEGLCKFLIVKCLVVENILIVAATTDNDREALLFEVRVSDYITDLEGPNYGQLYKRLNELIEQVNSSLLSKLCAKDKPAVSRTSEKRENVANEIDHWPSILVDDSAPSMHGNRYPPVPDFGSSDLMPGAGAGVFPCSVDPGGGGMLLGPNDPRWGSMGHGETPIFPDGERGIVPPGARYDPVGPPGVPGFEPNRFVRRGRRPGGGVNPDLEHFSPF